MDSRGSIIISTNERTYTILRAVSLTAGLFIYVRIASDTNIVVTSLGSTGKGLGTYFKIECLNIYSIDEE